MKPLEVIKHRDRILAEHALDGLTWLKIHNTLSGEFLEVAEMNPSTFKQYALTMVELNKGLNSGNSDIVEQELKRLQELNNELNKQIELNKLNTDKVEQKLNTHRLG